MFRESHLTHKNISNLEKEVVTEQTATTTLCEAPAQLLQNLEPNFYFEGAKDSQAIWTFGKSVSHKKYHLVNSGNERLSTIQCGNLQRRSSQWGSWCPRPGLSQFPRLYSSQTETHMTHSFNQVSSSSAEGRPEILMSPPCLESQGCQFDFPHISSLVQLPSPIALSVLSFSAFSPFPRPLFP